MADVRARKNQIRLICDHLISLSLKSNFHIDCVETVCCFGRHQKGQWKLKGTYELQEHKPLPPFINKHSERFYINWKCCMIIADSLGTGTHFSSWHKSTNPWRYDQSRDRHQEASSSTESTNEIQGPAWQCPGFHLSSGVWERRTGR